MLQMLGLIDAIPSLGETVLGSPLGMSASLAALFAVVGAGVGGSLHCALMCGPLAAAAAGPPARERTWRIAAWHGGRLAAYASIGALLGALGSSALHALGPSIQRFAPWIVALGLAASGLHGLERRLLPSRALAALQRLTASAGRQAGRRGPIGRAALLGAATPLLPCGLLWGVFLAAAAAGSAARGSLLLAAFAAGGAPMLLGIGWGGSRLAGLGRRAPRLGVWIRRGVPLLAAGLVLWRATASHPASAVTAAGASLTGPPACHAPPATP